MRKALLLLGVLVAAGSAHGAGSALPTPVELKGYLADLTAAGPTAALALYGNDQCHVRFFRLAVSGKPTELRRPNPCSSDSEAIVSSLWLGRTEIAAETYDSPSPHGESWQYFTGPTPFGPLHRVGGDWGWTDSDPPFGYGCRRAVVAGGGVIASAELPNRLGWEHGLEQPKPVCLETETTVQLAGATSDKLTVPGTWEVLATDGKHIALAALDPLAKRTGKVELLDFAGNTIPLGRPAPAAVRAATDAWLTPDGLILQSQGLRLYGHGWTTARAGAATLGEGRVVYAVGSALRVRRTGSGPDRLLLRLPPGTVDLAAGSFGVAIAVDQDGGTVRLYRLPWRTIDRTLTA